MSAETDIAPAEPTLRERAARVAIAKAMAGIVSDQETIVREELMIALMAARGETGTKSITVDIPGIGKVGTITLSEKKDYARVVDSDEFTAWVEETFPSEVQYIATVRPHWQKAFVEGTVALDTASGECRWVNDDGEVVVVPGLKAEAAGEPTSFALTFVAAPKTKPGEDAKLGGKEQVAALILGGKAGLTELLGAPSHVVVDVPPLDI